MASSARHAAVSCDFMIAVDSTCIKPKHSFASSCSNVCLMLSYVDLVQCYATGLILHGFERSPDVKTSLRVAVHEQ